MESPPAARLQAHSGASLLLPAVFAEPMAPACADTILPRLIDAQGNCSPSVAENVLTRPIDDICQLDTRRVCLLQQLVDEAAMIRIAVGLGPIETPIRSSLKAAE
jgi:hypothetical protein